MSRITELREKQDTVLSEARERLDQINANTDESRAAELETAHDAAMAEYDRLGGLIEREERTAEAEARAEERRKQRRPIPKDDENRGVGDTDSVEYRTVFAKVACGVPLDELSTEERTVLRSGVRSFEQRTQTAGTATAGGYVVPTELQNHIEVAMKAHGPMYDGTVVQDMTTSSGNRLTIPTVDDTGKSGAAHTEGADIADDGSQDVEFGQLTLDGYSFDTEFIKWSWELDQDSIFSMEALLGSLLGERLGRIANKQLTVGTGANAPRGIVTASGLGITAAAQAAITADELIDLEHSVDPAYRQAPGVGFQFNDTTLKAIRKLKDGDGNYLWTKGDFQNGVPATINGRRFHINQDMDNLGAGKKPVIFGDLKKYWVRKVGSPVIGVLRERFWPQIGIAGLIRFDGELVQPAAVKHLINAA
ncbi:phage major capsid protein [Brevundimonas faecalis]|uniref:phage major capsid protein n=1 Tax=Brevundimonas faecalis TaxID=947378 RepID=UPI0036134F91